MQDRPADPGHEKSALRLTRRALTTEGPLPRHHQGAPKPRTRHRGRKVGGVQAGPKPETYTFQVARRSRTAKRPPPRRRQLRRKPHPTSPNTRTGRAHYQTPSRQQARRAPSNFVTRNPVTTGTPELPHSNTKDYSPKQRITKFKLRFY